LFIGALELNLPIGPPTSISSLPPEDCHQLARKPQ
jgi:hypothetical protein